MVWILNPNNPSLGASKYYFTSARTYKVGRKDCDVIIQTDKTVSRLHAEIKVDPIDCSDIPDDGLTKFPKPRIFLRDVSKFGSFVNRMAGSKPVFAFPNKEKELNEGDLVTFGTDSSSFRLEYLPLLPHVLADGSKRESAASIVASVGGYAVQKWCTECTHLIVEDGSYVIETVIQAVAEKKPVVAVPWIEAVAARSSLSSEFPSFSKFTPNLLWKIDGGDKFLKIIEPEARLAAFKGFRFYVGSMYLYNYKDLLKLLVEASGGIVVSVTEVSRSRVSQNVQRKPAEEVLILPALEPKLQRWMSPAELKSTSHVHRTSEEKFIAAVLGGELREEYFEDPASPAASASSDETIEASRPQKDDDEISSSVEAVRQSSHLAKDFTSRVLSPPDRFLPFQSTTPDGSSRPSLAGLSLNHKKGYGQPESLTKEPFKAVEKPPVRSASPSKSQAVAPSENSVGPSESGQIILDYGGECKAEVEFRDDLVVRICANEPLEECVSNGFSVPNFKQFRKKHSTSGNSFATLVPFAKEPYRESDFNKELQEHMQQEKKRKQAEAMAEDLFNAEKLKRKNLEKKDVGKKGVGALLMSALHEGRLKA